METKLSQEKALERAHDIRKFEIELYWKRTTYFWAFLITSFGGYFAVLTSDALGTGFQKEQYLFLIESVGFIFALGWFYVNRASKHWQINWERVIDQLENEITGPLMKTNIINHNDFWNIAASYKFSVSRVNQLISLFIVLVWIVLMCATTVNLFQSSNFALFGSWIYPLTLLLVVVFTFLLSVWGVSEGGSNAWVIKWRGRVHEKIFGHSQIEKNEIGQIFPESDSMTENKPHKQSQL